MGAVCIGLMSGTSLDGVDGVMADFDAADHGRPSASAASEGATSLPLRVLAHAHQPFPAELANELLAMNTCGADELHRAAIAANALVAAYADVVRRLLASARLQASDIVAIGAHGQTVRHRPGEFDGIGYTLQLNNPALLAELCGIDVIADFRSRDVAAGGQGAPLVPAFHRAVFGPGGRRGAGGATGPTDQTRLVLNLGGIANLTVLNADGSTSGFDTGPANALLDGWCQRHLGRPYDDEGAWAAGGTVLPALLQALQREPFFSRSPPKSTGRDLFHRDWLAGHLAAVSGAPPFDARDVQCTLVELTAWCCAEAVLHGAPDAVELLVCGGGALNRYLIGRLSARLPGMQVLRSDAAGLPCQQVEAAAFAWLAWRFMQRRHGNVVSVTGARGERLLGALYPA